MSDETAASVSVQASRSGVPAIAAAGAVLGGLAALTCCVAPLAFVLVGISGAWIAYLTALSPYQPAFVAVAAGSIICGHLSAYRARRTCLDTACARPGPQWLVTLALWTGTLFVVVAVAANYAAPYLL